MKPQDIFMNAVTNKLYGVGFPFVCWEITLGRISVEVRDTERNAVTEIFDRAFISRDGNERVADHIVDKIRWRFDKKKYDEPVSYDFKY